MLRCLPIAAVLAIAPSAARAQQPAATKPDRIFVRQVQQRWMNERQEPAFTPMVSSSETVELLRMTSDPKAKTRTFSLSFSADGPRAGTARLTADSGGHIVALAARFTPRKLEAIERSLYDEAEVQRWTIFGGVKQQFATLPAAKVWDLVPVLGADPLKVGSHWRDTLDLHATLGEYRQSLRGARESTIVGDTLVGGARLWIVRDSARVHYEEHVLVEERTLDTLVRVDRLGDGTITGRHLLDPTLRLDVTRDDTMRLSGLAVLQYPDGRTFRTPTRYERVQRLEMLDEKTYEARQRARRSAEGDFSVVIRPEGDAERLASGDTAYKRALLDTLDHSRDPAALARAAGMLEMYGGVATGPRVRQSLLRAGDTAAVIRRLENEWMDRSPFTEEDLALLLPFLADPGRAFAFGLDRDPHYENARQALLWRPPATTPSAAQWPCSPAACRMLAAQWDARADHRLKSLALIARLTLDPRRWADTVRARFALGDRFLEPAVTFLDGVAATWAAGSQSPLPAPGASWRAWSNWMDGRNPGFAGPRTPMLARFEDTHVQVIRFAEALDGRDIVKEWRAALRAATSDSAQYVYGSMLLGMGESFDDVDGVARRLHSRSRLVRDLAAKEVSVLLDANARLADSATAEEVQGRVLAVALDSAPPWPVLDPTPAARPDESAMPRNVIGAADLAYERPAPTPGPLVLVGDDLAPAVRARWAARNVRIEDARWQPRSSESVIILSVSEVRQAGPFARVRIGQSHLTARVNGRGQSWYSDTILYLVRRDGQWFIVSTAMSIT